MKIIVDADSCPKNVRELILRTVNRKGIKAVFAANRPIPGVEGENSQMIICPVAENSADDRIFETAEKGDLAISRDLALAKRLLGKDVNIIDDRGRAITTNNINELLSLRNFTVGLADNGLGTERTANYGKKELKNFADSFDRCLTKLEKKNFRRENY